MQEKSEKEQKPNRLIHEKSPYLLQHAYNPVDWFPWGSEAFEHAKAQDKPVFVSIGYSACHWCHVMEKECFSDEEVAKLLSDAFVCVKVDREERPDVDSACMAVCHALGRSCGWPLNVIMTPDKFPFFATSYIPKNNRFGMIGLMDLIPQISSLWRTRRLDLEHLGANIMRELSASPSELSQTELDEAVLHEAYQQLALSFDEVNGGFGFAPKFPMPHNLLFLLRYWHRTGEEKALSMVEKTLLSMRQGGVFDQVGFGFHRYSTDAHWLIPHFEKMLYDQALLVFAYIEAYQATGAKEYRVTVEEVLEYVLRDLASPEGGFYSAEDADSEGEEGKFYLWTEAEVRAALPCEDADWAVNVFGIKTDGNYLEQGRFRSGKNILHLPKGLKQIASENNMSIEDVLRRLDRIRRLLLEKRASRIRPMLDYKVLSDWNGLIIAALAKANQVFGEQKYLEAATKAADFVLKHMRSANGLLYHRYAKGEVAVNGFLDDYAFLAWGLLEVYEACFEEEYLQAAVELMKTLSLEFWDEKEGGFYFTAKNSEQVFARRKEVYDGALPSGNSVALLNLLRLSRLTSQPAFEELAANTIKSFSFTLSNAPAAYTFMLLGVVFALGPAYTVTLVGDLEEKNMRNMLKLLRENYFPNSVISFKKSLTAETLGYKKLGDKATAYVCVGNACMPPANEVIQLLRLLGSGKYKKQL